jgi:tetratricopeptide (TPR) repeat protein
VEDKNPQLELATSLADKKDYANALDLCEAFIVANPASADGFRTRSHIYRRMGDYIRAIDDRTEGIQRSRKPHDYFFRGWWNLDSDNLTAAIEDLTAVLRLGDELDIHHYDESAFFFRSVAFLRSGRYEEALVDSENVRDDFLIYLRSGEVSKAQVVREAISRK